MCNTSFIVCQGAPKSCELLQGTGLLEEFVQRVHPDDKISRGFLRLMSLETFMPLLNSIAVSGGSVGASRSLRSGTQLASPAEVTGHAELVRLILAGRAKLLTAARRAAGEWINYTPRAAPTDLDVNLAAEEDEDLRSLCHATLLDDLTYVTTSLPGFLAFVLFGALSLLPTHLGPLLRWIFWRKLCVLTIRWRMRTAPQLHRYAIEKGKDDNYWPEGCVDE